jgi:hypothetical protein
MRLLSKHASIPNSGEINANALLTFVIVNEIISSQKSYIESRNKFSA